ncbi:hypothetical protein OGATHE_002989 [Ogataea polymorpha]|uniref:Uncharacterized protein n=1 Tax=Ogataea polymorpha TaxID=460523 RepID=A0A9P8T9M6_9ASCO|nr:hypothetical protein OGATHE_002989 [Ogataea polymorpha]
MNSEASNNTLDTNILTRVLQSVIQVWNELGDRPFVQNGSTDTLCNENLVALTEVSRRGGVGVGSSLLHGVDRPHTSVRLESLSVSVEVLTWRFRSSSKHASHHDTGCSQSKGLGDVADIGNTSVSNTWHAELVSKLGHLVDGSTLWSTTSHNLLGDTNRSRTHTYSETVCTSLYQLRSLFSGDNITGNDLQVWESLLDPLDHVQLENRITLRRV